MYAYIQNGTQAIIVQLHEFLQSENTGNSTSRSQNRTSLWTPDALLNFLYFIAFHTVGYPPFSQSKFLHQSLVLPVFEISINGIV